MAIIGIDLGTTNSMASVWRNGSSILIPNTFGEMMTPSAVCLNEDGTISVGKTAKERLITNPEATIASFKRFMGTDKEFILRNKRFTAPELSALVLRKLKEDAEKWLGEEVTEAVISVPAYFNEAQRAATKLAGSLAGLRVERLVNEPSAAALTCRHLNAVEDGCFMVFDLGGGTLDVSVVEGYENIVEIISVAGSNEIGGDDFDLIIAKRFCEQNKLDFNALEPVERAVILSNATRCKLSLTMSPQSFMLVEMDSLRGAMRLTNEDLAEMSGEMLAGIRRVIVRALHDCGRDPDEIARVALVGGSCNMPLIQVYIHKLLMKKFAITPSPDKTVALGLGVYTGMMGQCASDKCNILLTDICSFSLGVSTHNFLEPKRPLMSPIIERNSTLPSSKVERYCTVCDRQKLIQMKIYQGEEKYADDNMLLDKLEISVPPAPAGDETIDVRFTYDINGLLDVEATSVSTKQKVAKELISNGYQLSEQELLQKRRELAHLKTDPLDAEENRYLVARAQRLFVEASGRLREILVLRLLGFQQVLSKKKQVAAQKERVAFAEFLDLVEANLFSQTNL
jgi:molecular chaperone HscC